MTYLPCDNSAEHVECVDKFIDDINEIFLYQFFRLIPSGCDCSNTSLRIGNTTILRTRGADGRLSIHISVGDRLKHRKNG